MTAQPPERAFPPVSAFTAAAVGTIIGFGGTVALVVQAGQTMGASPVQIVSMVTALCLGIGLPGLLLSWRLKIPVILAWSSRARPCWRPRPWAIPGRRRSAPSSSRA